MTILGIARYQGGTDSSYLVVDSLPDVAEFFRLRDTYDVTGGVCLLQDPNGQWFAVGCRGTAWSTPQAVSASTKNGYVLEAVGVSIREELDV